MRKYQLWASITVYIPVFKIIVMKKKIYQECKEIYDVLMNYYRIFE